MPGKMSKSVVPTTPLDRAVERTGQAGHAGGDGEHGHLGEADVEADGGVGGRRVVEGHQAPAEQAAPDGQHQQGGEDEEPGDQQELGAVAPERQPGEHDAPDVRPRRCRRCGCRGRTRWPRRRRRRRWPGPGRGRAAGWWAGRSGHRGRRRSRWRPRRPSSEPPPAILPMTKAPMPMKENWQSETWPEYPVSRTRDSPTMPRVMTMPPRVSRVVPLTAVLAKTRATTTATHEEDRAGRRATPGPRPPGAPAWWSAGRRPAAGPRAG